MTGIIYPPMGCEHGVFLAECPTCRRPLLVFDGHAWFLRSVRVIEHDLTRDEKVYRCDAHLGGPFQTLREGMGALDSMWRGMARPAKDRGTYETRRAAGTCVRCGRRPARNGRTRCLPCGKRDAEVVARGKERRV